MAVSIPSLWSSSLRAFVRLFDTDVYWHTPHCRWALSPFCASWFVSSVRDDFAHDVFALHGRVEDFVLAALIACVAQFLTGNSCSSFFTLLLKTVLSLALVRFWCFLVHSGTFLFQENFAEGNCTRKKFNLTEIEACACAQRVVRPGHSINQNRDGVALSTLAEGRGENPADILCLLFARQWAGLIRGRAGLTSFRLFKFTVWTNTNNNVPS